LNIPLADLPLRLSLGARRSNLISDGEMHDVKVVDLLVSEPGAFYVVEGI
jgi:hypothetical protein